MLLQKDYTNRKCENCKHSYWDTFYKKINCPYTINPSYACYEHEFSERCKKCYCFDCDEDCKRCECSEKECTIITGCEKADYGWINPLE